MENNRGIIVTKTTKQELIREEQGPKNKYKSI